MREEDVPQEDSFYEGHLRGCYAVDGQGRYRLATSRGWSVEKTVTAEALAEMERQVEEVRREVCSGRLSPLAYHMAARQMTPQLLARHAGVWAWRVRRHMRPEVFRRLDPRWLSRYAACLDRSAEEMRIVPSGPVAVFGGLP